MSAKDTGTGKEQQITISGSSGLSKEEIEKMKREAEANAAADKKRREVIDLRNQGDSLVYQLEKQLKEHGDKVPGDVRGNIESAINNLKEALKSEDADRIRKAIENVQQVASKIGEAIYGKGGPQPGGGGPEAQAGGARAGGAAPGGKKDDDVIDAEYEVKE